MAKPLCHQQTSGFPFALRSFTPTPWELVVERINFLLDLVDFGQRPELRSSRRFSVGLTIQASFDRRQDGRTLVLNEDDEKLRWLRLAGFATNKVYVVGTFIKGLTRVKGDLLPPFDLHDHGAFQHIDECVRVMAMDRVLRAGGIFHDQHIALLTGDVA